MATAANQTVASGHSILIKYGNNAIGKCQGLEGDRSFGTEGVYEIGSIMPTELVNNRYEGNLTVERFFVRTQDLKAMGLASLGAEILTQDILTIDVVDKITGTSIRSYTGCTLVNYRETFRVNAIAGENATFSYLSATSGITANTGTGTGTVTASAVIPTV